VEPTWQNHLISSNNGEKSVGGGPQQGKKRKTKTRRPMGVLGRKGVTHVGWVKMKTEAINLEGK